MTNVVEKIRQVVGVEKVKVESFKKGTFKILAEKKRRPSARALWDAPGEAGYEPRKLVTPKKTYKKRPPRKE